MKDQDRRVPRRDFLKAAGTAGLAGPVPPCSPPVRRSPQAAVREAPGRCAVSPPGKTW
jgi:hypothetical protein